MAKIPIQEAGVPSFRAAATGDTFDNAGAEHLAVNNTSGTTKTVRLRHSRESGDVFTPTIDWDEECLAGIHTFRSVPAKWFNRPDGTVLVEYPDGVTGLGVTVLRIFESD